LPCINSAINVRSGEGFSPAPEGGHCQITLLRMPWTIEVFHVRVIKTGPTRGQQRVASRRGVQPRVDAAIAKNRTLRLEVLVAAHSNELSLILR
jgi:hypothetical protein